jgi:hypothetical protein
MGGCCSNEENLAPATYRTIAIEEKPIVMETRTIAIEDKPIDNEPIKPQD